MAHVRCQKEEDPETRVASTSKSTVEDILSAISQRPAEEYVTDKQARHIWHLSLSAAKTASFVSHSLPV